MPDAEDSTGDGGHREGGEVKGGQTGGQAGVLHTHLDGDGDTLWIMQTEQPTDAKAYRREAEWATTKATVMAIIREENAGK